MLPLQARPAAGLLAILGCSCRNASGAFIFTFYKRAKAGRQLQPRQMHSGTVLCGSLNQQPRLLVVDERRQGPHDAGGLTVQNTPIAHLPSSISHLPSPSHRPSTHVTMASDFRHPVCHYYCWLRVRLFAMAPNRQWHRTFSGETNHECQYLSIARGGIVGPLFQECAGPRNALKLCSKHSVLSLSARRI